MPGHRAYPGQLSYREPDPIDTFRIYSSALAQSYYVLQIADHEMGCITALKQKAAGQGKHSPFTGDWLPALNSTSGLFVNPDPIGQLSRYNGRNTAGSWNVLTIDARLGNTGRLNSWSLIVTPVAYSCGP